ncbi:MAG TPA: hypothetical protein VFS20_24885 [Longimicrobium sp.]|nr:hypothetical protein [Longimicrobium sp.]
MRLRTRSLLAAVLAVAAALPVPTRAQAWDTSTASRRGWSVDRAMRAFINELGYAAGLSFPRRGEWTWVVAREQADGSTVTGVQRFPAAQTDSAMDAGGPLCDSFSAGETVVPGTLMAWNFDGDESRAWRRVGRTRFVPPGQPASSPVFVEWRHEDGRWVISSYGEQRFHFTRLRGRAVNEVVPERPRTPLRLPFASGTRPGRGRDWFDSHRPITVARHSFVPYGLPRPLRDGDVVRYGTLDGVPVYVEPETRGFPQVVYVLADAAGSFQPYQNMSGNGCEH